MVARDRRSGAVSVSDGTRAGSSPGDARCEGCGASVEGDAAFCTSCGAPTGPGRGVVAIPGHVLVERLREDDAGATWSVRHATAGVLRLLRVESGNEAARHGGVLERSPILLRLDHPALVNVHDVISLPDGGVGLLADLPRGRPLGALARSFGALPLRETAAVLRPLVEALEAAREAGAPLAPPSADEVCVEREGRGWRVELAPVRLAPNEASDRRDEVASIALLGVVLLSGEAPVHPERRERQRMARALLRRVDVSPTLRETLDCALEPRAAGAPLSARDLLLALEAGEGGAGRHGGVARSRRLAWWLLGLGLLAAAAAAAFAVGRLLTG